MGLDPHLLGTVSRTFESWNSSLRRDGILAIAVSTIPGYTLTGATDSFQDQGDSTDSVFHSRYYNQLWWYRPRAYWV